MLMTTTAMLLSRGCVKSPSQWAATAMLVGALIISCGIFINNSMVSIVATDLNLSLLLKLHSRLSLSGSAPVEKWNSVGITNMFSFLFYFTLDYLSLIHWPPTQPSWCTVVALVEHDVIQTSLPVEILNYPFLWWYPVEK